ncbi:MAG: TldD/PmbA family protein [Chloroflexota bacterium]|nr:TldD/PmbA family protein [Chloroflexota bacterium]
MTVPAREEQNALELCADVVARTRAAGADEAEAYYLAERTTNVEVLEGRLDALTAAESRGIGLRVLIGGALAFAWASDLGAAGRAELADQATRLAREATPEPGRALPEPLPIPDRALDIDDPSLADVTTEQKVALLTRLEAAARAEDPRVAATHLCRYGDSVDLCAVVNSRGIAGAYRATSCYVALSTIARQDGEAQRGYAGGVAHGVGGLDVDEVGRRAARRATLTLGGEPIPTTRATVVLDPDIAAELLRGVTQALSGDAVTRGRSMFVGCTGQRVGSSLVTLRDRGNLPGGPRTAPFDGEGIPTGSTTLIETGVLRGFLHTSETARRAGTASTGNAIRSAYRVAPDVGPTNLVLEPGPLTGAELIRGVDYGQYVVATRNVGGINPVSGDYSVGASGRLIERGELTRPVTGVTIAGPMPELLANVVAVGSDARWAVGQAPVWTPTIRIDGVAIGGR